uniref:Ribonuclease H-like domain-containing protein n=1 Tax=Tanacetum cinerariifolium TaxID=118510 RepID=A0A6L2M6G4_TANCI|nr:ribonuclease H-like domain-containing protein [Tanacetum cinerariifolium]
MAALKYKDEHNKVGYLLKPTESDDYHQIIDFLSASHIRAPELGPPTILATIYMTLYTITEELVRSRLQADDGGVADLPIPDIYSGMDNLGYAPEGKLTFFKNKFSPQWRFLVHTLLHRLSTKSRSWDQFGSPIAIALICLSAGRPFNWFNYIFRGMVSNIGNAKKFLMYLRFLQTILGIETRFATQYKVLAFSSKFFANMRLNFARHPMPLLPAMLLQAQAGGGAEVLEHDHRSNQHESATGSFPSRDDAPLGGDFRPSPPWSSHAPLQVNLREVGGPHYTNCLIFYSYNSHAEVAADSDIPFGHTSHVPAASPCAPPAGPTGTSEVPRALFAISPGAFDAPTGALNVFAAALAVPADSPKVPADSPKFPAVVPTDSPYIPASVSSKGKSLMVGEDIPVKARRFRQMEEDRLGEEAAKRLHEEKMGEIERERAEAQRKRQQEVLESAKFCNEADWLNIKAQVEANASLSKTLLGDEVTKDNFPAHMAALIKKKRQALAEQLFKDRQNRPLTPGQQKAYMRQYVKNQSSAIYNTGWTMAYVNFFSDEQLIQEFEKIRKVQSQIQMQAFSRTLKRPGPVVDEPSTKRSKSPEAPTPSMPAVPISPVVTSPLLLVQGESLLSTFLKVVVDEDSDDEDSIDEVWSAVVGWEVLSTPLGAINVLYHIDGTTKHFSTLRQILHMGDLQVLSDSQTGGKGSCIWNNQNQWEIRSWRLYTLSNVHVLETVSSEVLSMFTDVFYPLSVELMKKMLIHKLEIDSDFVGNDLTTAEQLIQVFNSPMLYLLRVEMVINSPWIMPILGIQELASPKANGFWYVVPADISFYKQEPLLCLACDYTGSDNDSDHASIHNEALNNHQQPNIQPQIITNVSNNNTKFPYLKNDDLKRTRRDNDGGLIILPPTTAEEHLVVQRESKARTTLLQSILDDHIADFHYMGDAKDIWNAVKASATSTNKKMSYGDSLTHSSTTTYSVPSNSKTGSYKTGNVIKDVLQSFVTDTEPEQLAYKDLKQIEKLDLKEMDLKWQMTMLSIRVHKFEQKAGRKIDFDKKESTRFNKQKVRCYKCQQRGHFARECRSKRGNDKQRYSSFKIKEIRKKEEDSKALVTVNTLVDWTNHDSESDGVIAAKEFGMIAGCDSGDALKEGTAKLYNLITGANSEEANTAGDAGEFALMGVTFERINADVETAKKDLQTQLDNHVARTEKWRNSSKNLFKLIECSMSVRAKVGLGFTNCIGENKLGWDDSAFNVFTTNSEDVEGRPIFYRFAKTDSMKAVPPPLTRDYTSLSDHTDLDESQMSYGTKSSTSCNPKCVPNDFVSCVDSDKSSAVNTHDLASSDSGLKYSEHNPTDSSCASTSSVSTSMNAADIDSNVRTPIKEPISVQDLPSFTCNSFDKNEHSSRTSCNKNGSFNKKAGWVMLLDHYQFLLVSQRLNQFKNGKPKATPVPTGRPKGTPVPTGEPKATPVPTGKPTGTPVPTGKPKVHPVPTGKPKFTPVPTGRPHRPFLVATDRGCSPSVPLERLDDFYVFHGGKVTFGGGEGRITGKGTIRTPTLDFKNVYYVKEL